MIIIINEIILKFQSPSNQVDNQPSISPFFEQKSKPEALFH